MARQKKRPDGLFKITQTFDGKRFYGYGKTQKEARSNLAQKIETYENNKYKRTSDQTLNEYHSIWENARKDQVKESTLNKQQFDYRIVSETPIDDNGTTFGSLKLTEIEPGHIKIVQQDLKKRYHSNTVNQSMSHVKHIFNDAFRENAIPVNPFLAVKSLKRTEEKAVNTIHRALSREETKLFLENAVDSWYYDLFRFMLNTGCRVGEAAALQESDIDYAKNRILIKRTITGNIDGKRVIGNTTKTEHGTRIIPLTDPVKEILKHQKSINSKMFSLKSIMKNDLIFRSESNTLICHCNVNKVIQKTCQKANIEYFSSHAFRDTFSTRAIESGMNPKTLQMILGHADIRMTMNLYAHVMDDTKEKEMALVSVF